MAGGVLTVLDELVAQGLFYVSRARAKGGRAVNNVGYKVKAVQIVHYDHVEWSRACPFFFVTAHMQIFVVSATIGVPMNQPEITLVSEDDRLVGCKEQAKIFISVRPCGCSVCGWSFIKSTTFITRTFNSGKYSLISPNAARVSSVGTSPAPCLQAEPGLHSRPC